MQTYFVSLELQVCKRKAQNSMDTPHTTDIHTFKTALHCKSPCQSLCRFLEQGQQVLGAGMTRLSRQFRKGLARIDYLLLGGDGTCL